MFPDNSNIVGEVSTRILDFTSRWVRSATRDFDVIFASTIDPEWTLVHKPVLSTMSSDGRQIHELYTKARTSELDGLLVRCHRDCMAPIDQHPKGKAIKFTCTSCKSVCTTPLTKPSRNTRLGRSGLIKTVYPQERYRAEWKFPEGAHSIAPTEPEKSATSAGSTSVNKEVYRPAKHLRSHVLNPVAMISTTPASPAMSRSSFTSTRHTSPALSHSLSSSSLLPPPSTTFPYNSFSFTSDIECIRVQNQDSALRLILPLHTDDIITSHCSSIADPTISETACHCGGPANYV